MRFSTVCKGCPAESVMGEKVMMPALVSSDLLTEWKAFQKYIAKKKQKGLTFSPWKKLMTLRTTR